MKKDIWWLMGNALAGSPDFYFGIFFSSVIAVCLNQSIPWWSLLLVGGMWELVADLDIIWALGTKDKVVGNHHTTLLHRPAFMLTLTAVATAPFGLYQLVRALVCVFMHYVHDSKPFGSGIAWLWPFYPDESWSPLSGFSPLENSEHSQWIHTNWLQPSRLSMREILASSIAASLGVWLQSNVWMGALTATIIWIGTITFWWMVDRVKKL